ncbi:MAG: hypothetical protein E7300_04940 [Lachnospiraceae bacterium]|nr:hypothetical protein [Lachnospiraceae bacterium]
MTRNKKKTIIKTLAAVIAIVLGVMLAHTIHFTLLRKASYNRMEDFLHNKTNEDVLFVGNSTIMDGVIPAELWNAHGITSYILCAEYNDMDREPMMLRMALDYCKPKLVVLNVDNYWGKSEPENTLIGYHEFVDAFPLSETKIRTVCELYPDNAARAELLVPLYIYHDRWKELGNNDFRKRNQSRLFKGFELTLEVQQIEPAAPVAPENGNLLESAYGIESIKKIVSICRDRGIDVMLVTVPYEANEEEMALTAGVHKLADALEVPYINFFDRMDLFDTAADFKDINHVNLYGAEKVTEALGEYLAEHYDLPDHRSEEAYASWHEDYEDYRAYREEALSDKEEE